MNRDSKESAARQSPGRMGRSLARMRAEGRDWLLGSRPSMAVWIDAFVVSLALSTAFLLRFEGAIPTPMLGVLWRTLVMSIGLKIPVFITFQMYRFSWRHVGVSELLNTSLACAVGSSLVASAVLLLRHEGAWGAVPRSVLGIDFALTLLLVTWVRITPRLVAHLAGRGKLGKQATRAIIVGAGDAGAQLARALQQDPALTYHVVGFVDDDRRKRGMLLHGVRVLGSRKQLGAIVKSLSVRAILIAMPSAQPGVIQETVALARAAAVPDVKILPLLSELYAGHVSAADLRTLEPADVLHREEVRVDAFPIRAFLEGACILVTGAAGSIGSELCRQILRFGVKRLVALDFDETGLFYLESELRHRFPEQEVDVVVSDVRDAAGIDALVERVRPDVVYHAAAYKHVPMMERFPAQAIKTNVEGTRNVLESSCRVGSKAFVLISTDKAVNPTSVMGASKRVAEILVRSCQSASTRCLAVRFGNVLGSRGSVLRTFQGQVERRQAVTVTHPDMVRYFMLTSEAVQLVLQASAVGTGGQVLVLDMGRPVKIVDLARDVIRFYGLEPDVDVPIVYTGIRPGEKLFEELLTAEEGTDKTDFARLLVARMQEPPLGWRSELNALVRAAHADDPNAVRATLRRLVPTYQATKPATPIP